MHLPARFRSSLYPRFDAALFQDLLRELAVSERATIDELSRGQRAGVVVGLALAQKPDLLLLDDPTLGLDPLARRRIVQGVLGATRDRAITVVMATHELGDVERVADDVVLLARGRGVLAIEAEQLVAEAAAVFVPGGVVDRRALTDVEGVVYVWPRRNGHEVVLRGDSARRSRAELELSERAGVDLVARAVTFEELALAWLAAQQVQP